MKLLVIVMMVLLAACSQVDYADRVAYCESKGMSYWGAQHNGFTCFIGDLDYVRETTTTCVPAGCAQSPPGVWRCAECQQVNP